MGHDDFQTEPIRGLPEILPKGEEILWQGRPATWALAKEALSFWWVAGWFTLIFAWNFIAGLTDATWVESAAAASFFLVLGALVCAMLLAVAFLQARSTVYTITTRRVAMRIGAALTMTLNIPLAQIEAAALSMRPDGTGSIALAAKSGNMRFSYMMTWPHVRPWRMNPTQPALRCIPDPEPVARLLAETAEAEISRPVIERRSPPTDGAVVAAE